MCSLVIARSPQATGAVNLLKGFISRHYYTDICNPEHFRYISQTAFSKHENKSTDFL